MTDDRRQRAEDAAQPCFELASRRPGPIARQLLADFLLAFADAEAGQVDEKVRIITANWNGLLQMPESQRVGYESYFRIISELLLGSKASAPREDAGRQAAEASQPPASFDPSPTVRQCYCGPRECLHPANLQAGFCCKVEAAILDGRKELDAKFVAHTEAVGDFLNELYAVMVDPLAEGTITVAEMKDALLKAAIRDRDAETSLASNDLGNAVYRAEHRDIRLQTKDLGITRIRDGDLETS